MKKNQMKALIGKTLGKALANASYGEATKNANSACNVFWGQTEEPKGVKRLRKF